VHKLGALADTPGSPPAGSEPKRNPENPEHHPYRGNHDRRHG
jgi:hypothetical protein